MNGWTDRWRLSSTTAKNFSNERDETNASSFSGHSSITSDHKTQVRSCTPNLLWTAISSKNDYNKLEKGKTKNYKQNKITVDVKKKKKHFVAILNTKKNYEQERKLN